MLPRSPEGGREGETCESVLVPLTTGRAGRPEGVTQSVRAGLLFSRQFSLLEPDEHNFKIFNYGGNSIINVLAKNGKNIYLIQ